MTMSKGDDCRGKTSRLCEGYMLAAARCRSVSHRKKERNTRHSIGEWRPRTADEKILSADYSGDHVGSHARDAAHGFVWMTGLLQASKSVC